MRSDATPRARLAVALVAATLLALTGSVAAHATLVFGTVTTEPAPPRAGEPVEIRLELTDPTDAPVEDAVLVVEADPQARDPAASGAAEPVDEAATSDAGDGSPGDAPIVSDRFDEVGPGVYRSEIVLPSDGVWTLTFRDRTFRQEEARASITMRVGEDAAAAPLSFIFPPTATGSRSLATWLVWLIGLPIVAGVVVTVVVLRGPSTSEAGEGDETPDVTPANGAGGAAAGRAAGSPRSPADDDSPGDGRA